MSRKKASRIVVYGYDMQREDFEDVLKFLTQSGYMKHTEVLDDENNEAKWK